MMFKFCILSSASNHIKRLIQHRFVSSHSLTLENIHCYGSLVLKCPQVSAHVKCINPHDVPDGDKAFIHVKSSADNFTLKNFSIHYQKDISCIQIKMEDGYEDNVPNDASLHIEVPHIYNLDIDALQINIAETEGEILKAISQMDCTFGKLKTLQTQVVSAHSILCQNLLGDGSLKAAHHVSIKKLQSKNIDLECESINISAAYCPDFKCRTTSGKINITNMHGSGTITSQSGSVIIGTLDGNLDIQTKSGNIDVVVENCVKTNLISTNGDIEIGLGDSVSAFIESKAQHIDVPEDLLVDGMKEHSSTGCQYFEGRYGDGLNSIVAHTQTGNVSFSKKNWFSKFQFNE